MLVASTGGYFLAKRSLAPVAFMAAHAADIGASVGGTSMRGRQYPFDRMVAQAVIAAASKDGKVVPLARGVHLPIIDE